MPFCGACHHMRPKRARLAGSVHGQLRPAANRFVRSVGSACCFHQRHADPRNSGLEQAQQNSDNVLERGMTVSARMVVVATIFVAFGFSVFSGPPHAGSARTAADPVTSATVDVLPSQNSLIWD
jgi:hypothetical protein